MKKVVIIVSCLLLLASVGTTGLSCGGGKTKIEVSWKLATPYGPNDLQTLPLINFANLVKQKSDGRMEVNVFTTGTLYQDENEIWDALRSGTIDVGVFSAAAYFGVMPKVAATFTASTWVSPDVAKIIKTQKALDQQLPIIQQQFTTNNVKNLMWLVPMDTAWYFKKSVKTIADLKGLKIMTTGGGANNIILAMGATPVNLDVSDIYTSAQTGLIDGVSFIPMDMYMNMKLSDVVPYVTQMGFPTPWPIMVNQGSLNGLTSEFRSIVLEAAQEAETQGVANYQTSLQTTIQNLKNASGVTVYALPDSERTLWLNTGILPIMTGLLQTTLSPDEMTQYQAIVAQALAG